MMEAEPVEGRAGEQRDPVDGLADGLVQTAFVTMAALSRIGAENDLSLTQLRVFGILRDRRLKMTALAAYLGLEKSTMTGLVNRAEKRGLLTRAPNADDGRAVDVFLTQAGVALAERIYPEVVRALAPMTNNLTGPEQHHLRELLNRLLATADT